jgi:tetratricopeptide (TPR) repeat protein
MKSTHSTGKKSMKNTLLLGFVLISSGIWAQKEVVSAFNANKAGKYAEAAGYINQAIADAEMASKEKTWRYRGDIYVNVARTPALQSQFPGALQIAFESYLVADSLDKKDMYKREIDGGMGQVQALSMEQALEQYNRKDYGSAAQGFDLATQVSSHFSILDTTAIFNSALCYEKADQVDLAIARYLTCAQVGYQVPNTYLFISGLLRKAGRNDEALATLRNARLSFPNEQALVIEELNIYLEAKDYQGAEDNLLKAIELEPTNEILWFSLGSVYDNLGRSQDAEKAYMEAIRLKPEYFDANYNLGAMFFNMAVQDINKANDMWTPKMTPAQKAEEKALQDNAKVKFEKAIPYLEAASKINPEDRDTLRSLRDIYTRLGNDAKVQEINGRMGN